MRLHALNRPANRHALSADIQCLQSFKFGLTGDRSLSNGIWQQLSASLIQPDSIYANKYQMPI